MARDRKPGRKRRDRKRRETGHLSRMDFLRRDSTGPNEAEPGARTPGRLTANLVARRSARNAADTAVVALADAAPILSLSLVPARGLRDAEVARKRHTERSGERERERERETEGDPRWEIEDLVVERTDGVSSSKPGLRAPSPVRQVLDVCRCFYSLSLLFSLCPSIPIDQCALRMKFVAKRKIRKKRKKETKGKKVEEEDWTQRLREKVLVRRREKEEEIGGGRRETKERDDKIWKNERQKIRKRRNATNVRRIVLCSLGILRETLRARRMM